MVNLTPNPDFKARSACVLGATGSVGTQTLDVLRELGIPAVMMTAGSNTELFADIVREFRPRIAAVASEEAARALTERLGSDSASEILWKRDEVLSAVRETEADVIFHSVAGLAGIPSALAAADSGKRVAMANKEAVIACGDLLFEKLARSGGELIPVDSEHSALYRCLEGRSMDDVQSLLLTASGGPFHGRTAEELSRVTPEDALRHPTWKMGVKITVDSATLMNKGFEIIEAVRLFGVPEDRVDVVVHRQSIVHSLVRFEDGVMLAALGNPDMRDCIRYAATAPHAARTKEKPLDLTEIGSLTFEKPDLESFPLLGAARQAIRTGGTAPAGLIAADEEAVAAFLAGRAGFTELSSLVMETLSKITIYYDTSEESAAQTAREAALICRGLVERKQRV